MAQSGSAHLSHQLKRRAAHAPMALLALALAAPALAQTSELEPHELADLSLEALANTRVTSVSKRAEPVSDAAASIFVVTGESIRRAGVTTLPEALRLAPNLQVARIDARSYAITARGFNQALENKLLVLIDGRSVYSPLFSGVFWEAQDVMLEDVERIEVISGPGATLWGANAVNGVINIITKAAGATQGALASVAGDREHRVGGVRYGGELGNGGRYRVYARVFTHDDIGRENGNRSFSGYNRSQAGFRADWGPAGEGVTVQGDAYTAELHVPVGSDTSIAGANLLGRKTMRLAGGAELSAQAYWDYTERKQANGFVEHLNTADIQLQSAMTLGTRHRLVAGAGYRVAMDRIDNGSGFAILPGDLNLHWGNVFVQSESELSERLRVIVGAKVEHNNYTGVEFLPTVRVAFKPSAASSLWSSFSRTVRAPSRIDRDFFVPSNPPIVNGVPRYVLAGGPDFQSEVARVAELGYRIQPSAALSLSVTAFASQYDRLRTLEPNPGGAGQVFANMASGRNRGVEMWADWQAAKSWRLSAGAVLQRVRTTLNPGSLDTSAGTGVATSDPDRYMKLRSSHDIGNGHSVDLVLRHHGRLATPGVPAYGALDLNYIWQLRPGLELALAARNLLDARHAEFGPAATRSEFRRNAGLKLVWRQ